MRSGAIILCGGKSSRLGTDKSQLAFGPESLLERTVRIIGDVVEAQDIIVVASPTQHLPNVAHHVVRDERPYSGPLAAMMSGAV